VQELSRAAARAQEIGRRLFAEIRAPWSGFLDEVCGSIGAINVSFRIDRRVSGALHKETFYSKPQESREKDGKPQEYRHVRKPLKRMSLKDVEAIVDPRIRECVQARLRQLGGDPEKAFSEPADHPYTTTRDGRLIPIHKARVRERVRVFPVGKAGNERHVAPGNNHHMEIVAVLDARGKAERWTGQVVSLFQAAQRKRDGKPVVCRDHDEGKEFVFSLACGEYVQMEYERGKRDLYRVAVITEGQIEFRLHTDARPIKVEGRKRVRKSPGQLLKIHARKVTVDPLGKILPAHD
jgi:CRISPR-associated endonuclease Csn1